MHPPRRLHYRRAVTKGGRLAGISLARAAARPGPGTPERWTCHPGLPGSADTAALTPPPGSSAAQNHKANKGVRERKEPPRGSGESPPPARPRPFARPPLAADQGLAAPRSLVSRGPPVTGAGEAAEGQPGWENQMAPALLPPPPSLLRVPAGLAALRRGPEGLGPGSAGPHPREKVALSKGHHPSAGARVGPAPPIPRPEGWEMGAPNFGR